MLYLQRKYTIFSVFGGIILCELTPTLDDVPFFSALAVPNSVDDIYG
ncbi:MAG: hypothetical protein ACKVTZ_12570 [Bacteroidia bacterium]